MSKKEHRRASNVELAKSLKAIKDVSHREDYEAIRKILLPIEASASVENAMKGLSEEDEFALLCRLMGTTTHLIRLEQRPIIRGDYIVPDYLVRFKPGCTVKGYKCDDSQGFSCLIEVKSTNKDKFKISGSLLKRRRNFAETFGLPLLFAIRFLRFQQHALWIIVEDNRTSSSLEVTFQNMIDGVRHIIWDEYWYFMLPNLYFVGVYDKSYNGVGASHLEYGRQKEFRIVNEKQVITLSGDEAFLIALFFEGFNLKEVEAKHEDGLTLQFLVPQNMVCSIADMVYICNRLPRDERDQSSFDASRILAFSDQESPFIADRNFLDKIFTSLNNAGLLFMIGVGNLDTHLQKWRAYGGMK